MNIKHIMAAVLLAAGAFIASFCVFTVGQAEKAVKFRLGEIVRVDYEPGLHFKLPFVNNIQKFDGRILTLDALPERFLTAEKKNVQVDSFVKWRISDLKLFYTTMSGSEAMAVDRLSQWIKNGLKDEFGKRTIREVVSGERNEIMTTLTRKANAKSAQFGMEVVDVRIKRIDLPEQVSESVYRRMEAERTRVAKELRSQGAEAAERVRADADRQRQVILAEAYSEAEQVRGEGDAKATEVYAHAYQQDAEFYGFYRRLGAYRNAMTQQNNLMVLQPDGDFFRYFKDSGSPR